MESLSRLSPMSRRQFAGGAALIGLGATLGGLPSGAGAANAAAKVSDWPNLRRVTSDYVNSHKVANMLAVIGMGQGDPVVVGSGRDTMGGDRKADLDSLYRIYSMTKPITGLAVMSLIEDGKLRLDQPVAEILPKFANMRVQKIYDGSIGPENLEPVARPITIRHLLTHTGGIGYSIVQQGPLSAAMEAAGVVSGQVSRIPMEGFMRGTPVGSLELFADRLADMPLVYQPGTKFSYSASLDLLGRVIEVVSGVSFDRFLHQRIFEPCGMKSTWFRVPQDQVERLTTNYGVVEGMLLPLDPGVSSIFLDKPAFPFGGSGLVSSPRDYDRFLKMVAGGGVLDRRRVLSAEAVRVGTSNLLTDNSVGKGTMIEGYGHGAGARVGWAGGPRAFVGAGAAGTVAFVDPDSGLRCGLFTQFMPSSAYPLFADFENAATADLALAQGAGAGT